MERNHLARIFQKTKQLENEVQMRDAAPQIIRRKNSWNSREPSPAERENFPLFLNSHQPKYHKFKKVQNGAGITVLVFFLKKKSKAIGLKSHIRGRNPLYRRKPEFGKKVLGIQGNQPCPAKKSSHYFLDSHQRNPAFFQKPKTAPKLRFSV